MIRLHCGVSRKVGQPDYGSRGASCALEVELPPNAFGDYPRLEERMRTLFAVVREAVNQELGIPNESRPALTSELTAPSESPLQSVKPGNGRRPASAAQLRVLAAICARRGVDPEDQAHQTCHRGLSDLSLEEASYLIDQIKALPVNRR